MLPCVSLLKLDVFSLNLPGTGMGYLASPWISVHSCDCGLMARCQSKSSCSDSFNCRGRRTTSSLFWAVPAGFCDEGLSKHVLCPSVQEHHLQHSGPQQKGGGWCLLWLYQGICGVFCRSGLQELAVALGVSRGMVVILASPSLFK